MKNKKNFKKPGTFGWYCSWTNGKGSFNPDYEGCSMQRSGYKTALSAAKAADKHVQNHSWGRWGYPDDSNWRDHYVGVIEFLPYRWNEKRQKERNVGYAADIIKASIGEIKCIK